MKRLLLLLVAATFLTACSRHADLIRRVSEGDPIAQYEYGRCLLTGQRGVKKDPALAVGFLHPAAEGGYAPAQAVLALCYERGLGTAVSLKDARRWYAAAAEQGNLSACRELLRLELAAKHPKEASRYLFRLAEHENPAAQLALGKLCLKGALGEAHRADGIRYVRYAAMQGDREACLLMAECYETGQGGLPQNAALAQGWRTNAAD